jgi:hypothetical protein
VHGTLPLFCIANPSRPWPVAPWPPRYVILTPPARQIDSCEELVCTDGVGDVLEEVVVELPVISAPDFDP